MKQLDEHSIQHSALLGRQRAATLANADAIATAKGKAEARAEARAQRAMDATVVQHEAVIAERDATIAKRDATKAALEGQLRSLQLEVKCDARHASEAKRKRKAYAQSKCEDTEQRQRRRTGGYDARTATAAGAAIAKAMEGTFANDAAEVDGMTAYFKANPEKLAAICAKTGHDVVIAQDVVREVEAVYRERSFAAKYSSNTTQRAWLDVRNTLMHTLDEKTQRYSRVTIMDGRVAVPRIANNEQCDKQRDVLCEQLGITMGSDGTATADCAVLMARVVERREAREAAAADAAAAAGKPPPPRRALWVQFMGDAAGAYRGCTRTDGCGRGQPPGARRVQPCVRLRGQRHVPHGQGEVRTCDQVV